MNTSIDGMSAGFMLGVVYRKATAMLQQRLSEYEITPEQWSVLYCIVQAEGLIQKRIAAYTYKDNPTVTRILHQLESKALIERRADEEDRRSTRIYSTDKGRTIITSTIPIERGVTDEMIDCLGEEQYALFMESLLKLKDHFLTQTEADDL